MSKRREKEREKEKEGVKGQRSPTTRSHWEQT